MGGLIFVLVIAVAVLAIPVAIAIVVWRGRQVKALAERGVDIEGRVVRRLRSGAANGGVSRGRRIEFRYMGPDGQAYTRYHNATQREWESFAEGAAFPLVCLPDDPGVSAARALVDAARGNVDAARAALRKSPQQASPPVTREE